MPSASKYIVETNKISKPGNVPVDGIFVGLGDSNRESFYAVRGTGSGNVVIYDKVLYEVEVGDIMDIEPDAQTVTISSYTSKRTHGDGVQDMLYIAPMTVEVTANQNTGATKDTTVNVNQSFLPDGSVTGTGVTITVRQKKDYPTGLTFAIQPKATTIIPASGGSVTSALTNFEYLATADFKSGKRVVDVTSSCTITADVASVTAQSKGTTVTGVTKAGSITFTATYTCNGETVTSQATADIKQQENELVNTDYSGTNINYVAAIDVSDGITAGESSASVTATGSHTHEFYYLYTSNAVSGPYERSESDAVEITLSGNTSNRFSYADNTNILSHASMQDDVTTDTYTIVGTNISQRSAYATKSGSVTNILEDSNYAAGTYNAFITIDDSNIVASGGSGTITAWANHMAYDYYTSTYYTNEHTVNDGIILTKTEDIYSAFTVTNGGQTLEHADMRDNVRTDTCTITVANGVDPSVTDEYTVSVENKVIDDDYMSYDDSYYINIDIEDGIVPSGGTANVDVDAGHVHHYRYKYTSEYVSSEMQRNESDTATVNETSDPNNRFTYNPATSALTHENMGTYVGYDECVLTAVNNGDSGVTSTAGTGSYNAVLSTSAYDYTVYVSVEDSIVASSSTASVYSGATHKIVNTYASGAHDAQPQTVQDGVIIETASTTDRFVLNGNTLSHSSMGTNLVTDTCTITAKNASNTATTVSTVVEIENRIVTDDYDSANTNYVADVYLESPESFSPTGGTSTVSSGAGHTHVSYVLYDSGAITGPVNTPVDDDVIVQMVTNTNRFHLNGNVLSHDNMGTDTATTDSCYLKATNVNNSGATAQTEELIIANFVASSSAYGYTAQFELPDEMPAYASSYTITDAVGSHKKRDVYASGEIGPETTVTDDGVVLTLSANTARFALSDVTLSGATLHHDGMGTDLTTDTCYVTAKNAKNEGATAITHSTEATNFIVDYDYQSANTAYDSTISIEGDIVASGGSISVSGSAEHTHLFHWSYASNAVSEQKSRTEPDPVDFSISANTERFTLTLINDSAATVTHDNMGTFEGADECYIYAKNRVDSGNPAEEYVSISNGVVASSAYNYTVNVEIESGITAGLSTANIWAEAYHLEQREYASGAKDSATTVQDSIIFTKESDSNNRYTITDVTSRSATLKHESMGKYTATTDDCTIKVQNSGDTSVYATDSVSVENRVVGVSGYDYYVSVSIDSDVVASACSAELTTSAGHMEGNMYSSGDHDDSGTAVIDTASLTMSANTNRFSYTYDKSEGTGELVHQTMGTSATTDVCIFTAVNDANPIITCATSVSVLNEIVDYDYNASDSGYFVSINLEDSDITAAGGSAEIVTNAGHTHKSYYLYTSNALSEEHASGVTDDVLLSITSGGTRFQLNGTTLRHENMGSAVTTDYCQVTAANSANPSTTNFEEIFVDNTRSLISSSDTDYKASIEFDDWENFHASGGSSTVTVEGSHTHTEQYKYSSGALSPEYSGKVDTDGVIVSLSANTNRFTYDVNSNTLIHDTMGTSSGHDVCYLIATNAKNNSATARTSDTIDILNEITGYVNSDYSVSLNVDDNTSAAGGSATVTSTTAGHTSKPVYTSGAEGQTAYTSDNVVITVSGVTSETRFTYDSATNTIYHANMGSAVTTDTCWFIAKNANNLNVQDDYEVSATNRISSSTETIVADSYFADNLVIEPGLTAGNSQANVSARGGHDVQSVIKYDSGYEISGSTTTVYTDAVNIFLSASSHSNYTYANGILRHASLGTAPYDYYCLVAQNVNATGDTGMDVLDGTIQNNSRTVTSDYAASVAIGTGIAASGGSAAITASATHKSKVVYDSGYQTQESTVSDTPLISLSGGSSSRYTLTNVSQTGATLNHETMGTTTGSDACVVVVQNSAHTATTASASTSVTNTAVISYSEITGISITPSSPTVSSAATSVSLTGSARQTQTITYDSGSQTSTDVGTLTYVWSSNNADFIPAPVTGNPTTVNVNANTGDARTATITLNVSGSGNKTGSTSTTVEQSGATVITRTVTLTCTSGGIYNWSYNDSRGTSSWYINSPGISFYLYIDGTSEESIDRVAPTNNLYNEQTLAVTLSEPQMCSFVIHDGSSHSISIGAGSEWNTYSGDDDNKANATFGGSINGSQSWSGNIVDQESGYDEILMNYMLPAGTSDVTLTITGGTIAITD